MTSRSFLDSALPFARLAILLSSFLVTGQLDGGHVVLRAEVFRQYEGSNVVHLAGLYRSGRYVDFATSLEAVSDYAPILKYSHEHTSDWSAPQRATFLLETAAGAYRVGAALQEAVLSTNRGVAAWRISGSDKVAALASKRDAALAAADALLELGCTTVRVPGTEEGFVVAWFSASIALLEGVETPFNLNPRVGGGRLRAHINHAGERLDRGVAALAHAVMAEQFLWHAVTYEYPALLGNRVAGDVLFASQLDSAVRRAYSEALAALEEAAREPSTRIEAQLRKAAVLSLRSEGDDLKEAARLLSQLTAEYIDDRELAYLAELFNARLLESNEQLSAAEAAYRSASQILPSAHAAKVGWAALAFRRNDVALAGRLAESTLLSASQPDQDPWILYRYGDFRHWPRRRTILRGFLK